jgi:3-phenylpropionate/trans-cinnamate dioxygenase ferredoxin reductase subunit
MLFEGPTQLNVTVLQTGECFPCSAEESLLAGMLRLGRKGIPAGCVNGGCGVCKVRILEGATRSLGPVSRAHISMNEEAQGFTLACRVAPESPVLLEVSGKLNKTFSLGRANPATARPFPQQQSN